MNTQDETKERLVKQLVERAAEDNRRILARAGLNVHTEEQLDSLLDCFDVPALREQHHMIVSLAKSCKTLRTELATVTKERDALLATQVVRKQHEEWDNNTVKHWHHEAQRLQHELDEACAEIRQLKSHSNIPPEFFLDQD
jgi:hypothetical protein